MAKNREVEEVSVEVVAPVAETPVATTQIFVRAPRTKVYSFEQWAQLKNKHDRHMRGMKAFLGTLVVNKYPLETWDEMMKSY